jgi:chromosomal replication initiation ATPase DnaA
MCTISEISTNNGINAALLTSPSQEEEICFQRFICWRCLHRKESKTYLSIANIFNRKSHATIISGIQAIDNMEQTKDPKYKSAIANHKCFCTNEQPEYYI